MMTRYELLTCIASLSLLLAWSVYLPITYGKYGDRRLVTSMTYRLTFVSDYTWQNEQKWLVDTQPCFLQ